MNINGLFWSFAEAWHWGPREVGRLTIPQIKMYGREGKPSGVVTFKGPGALAEARAHQREQKAKG